MGGIKVSMSTSFTQSMIGPSTITIIKKRIFNIRNILCFSERGSVRNLRVKEETTNSFRVSWQAAPGSVIRYRLSYIPLSGIGEILEAQTIGTETSIVLQELFPVTTYRVSVSAEYGAGMGDEKQVDGTTKEGESTEYRFTANGRRLGETAFSALNINQWLWFSFSPWLSSWPSCLWWDHIYNEAGMAGCSRKCRPVPHCL